MYLFLFIPESKIPNEKRKIKVIAMIIELVNKRKINARNELKRNAKSISGFFEYWNRRKDKEGNLYKKSSIIKYEKIWNPNNKMKNPNKNIGQMKQYS